jgi:hypothetical protein
VADRIDRADRVLILGEQVEPVGGDDLCHQLPAFRCCDPYPCARTQARRRSPLRGSCSCSSSGPLPLGSRERFETYPARATYERPLTLRLQVRSRLIWWAILGSNQFPVTSRNLCLTCKACQRHRRGLVPLTDAGRGTFVRFKGTRRVGVAGAEAEELRRM